jgi:hypothetical protein
MNENGRACSIYGRDKKKLVKLKGSYQLQDLHFDEIVLK